MRKFDKIEMIVAEGLDNVAKSVGLLELVETMKSTSDGRLKAMQYIKEEKSRINSFVKEAVDSGLFTKRGIRFIIDSNGIFEYEEELAEVYKEIVKLEITDEMGK